MIAALVYILCALTSLACTVLLWRGFARSGTRLLLWSALCFAGLTLNNVLLFLDKIVVKETDLTVYRSSAALAAMVLLLFGLIWDSE